MEATIGKKESALNSSPIYWLPPTNLSPTMAFLIYFFFSQAGSKTGSVCAHSRGQGRIGLWRVMKLQDKNQKTWDDLNNLVLLANAATSIHVLSYWLRAQIAVPASGDLMKTRMEQILEYRIWIMKIWICCLSCKHMVEEPDAFSFTHLFPYTYIPHFFHHGTHGDLQYKGFQVGLPHPVTEETQASLASTVAVQLAFRLTLHMHE